MILFAPSCVNMNQADRPARTACRRAWPAGGVTTGNLQEVFGQHQMVGDVLVRRVVPTALHGLRFIKRMCGRFTLRNVQGRKLDWILTRAGWVPRYNIAPTQDILVVMPDGDQKEVVSLRWGLIPWWSQEPKGFINARVETIEQKRSFKDSFERRRCLILADGFYEWERIGKISQPYYFQMKDQRTFTFAGIWDRWQQGGQTITSCAIITTVANELLAKFHTRMPVILESELHNLWLDENTRVPDLKELLIPFPADQMMSHAVTYDVNNVRIDEERLVHPVEPNIGVTLPLFQ